MTSLVEQAIMLATTAHAGQFDKAKQPYIFHVLRVGLAGKTVNEQVVGFLHDIIEDTPVKLLFIREMFGSEVADAVATMTRGWRTSMGLWLKDPTGGPVKDLKFRKETYEEFIQRCLKNPIARRMKVRDILDNLARMGSLPAAERGGLIARYRAALKVLEEVKGGTDGSGTTDKQV